MEGLVLPTITENPTWSRKNMARDSGIMIQTLDQIVSVYHLIQSSKSGFHLHLDHGERDRKISSSALFHIDWEDV